ncbi:MAG: endonuclease V [Acidimicrobiales bacterium]
MSEEELESLQEELGRAATEIVRSHPWTPGAAPLFGGCFVAGSLRPYSTWPAGEPAWAAAVAISRCASVRGRDPGLDDSAVLEGNLKAPYVAGRLALRHGPILADVVAHLDRVPDVLLVDATGLDHPRRAGLAVHLGAVTGLPTVGVTHRPLLARGVFPPLQRGEHRAVHVDGELVGYWVCTRSGARPVLAHAAWRTNPETAADVVIMASTDAARTPVPVQQARRIAREARAGLSSG